MEEEKGHRASVSMPSLDDFPSQTSSQETADFPFESTPSESQTEPEPVKTSTEEEQVVNRDAPEIDELPKTNLIEEASRQALIESVDFVDNAGDSMNIEDNSVVLSEEPPAEELLSSEAVAVMQTEALDESQGEEDPSIAIDQFIKKIADEQLSSKRMEERKEETEESDKPTESENLGEEAKPQETAVEEKITEPVPMDVSETNPVSLEAAMTENGDVAEDEHMAESIEEIRKEIARIPAKQPKPEPPVKPLSKEVSNNGTDAVEEESIQQILEGRNKPKKIEPVIPVKQVVVANVKIPSIEDSGEVSKNDSLITRGQQELKERDVLVCGRCLKTFHFIEELSEHKQTKCKIVKSLLPENESDNKSQIWGFCLWKAKLLADNKGKVPSSWTVYQRWCKISDADKSAWITAGQSVMYASKVAAAKVEIRSGKLAKPISQKPANDSSMEFVESNKENSSNLDLDNSTSNILKKGITRPVKLNNDVTIMPSSKKDEFVVEKIMAKRFNPRKKTWEYHIKWENFGHENNSWEPVSNLQHCKKLLDQFEEQLKKMKEEKAKLQAQIPSKGRGRPSNQKYVPIAPKVNVSSPGDDAGGSGNRPQRSSKQKAVSQLKDWCGSISDEDPQSSLKRKFETDDSDDDFDEKRMKLEEDSDFSDKEISKTKPPIKKYTPSIKSTPIKTTPLKNGNSSIGSPNVLPSNILIPDANGVVRINQKQLPSLSSGVYIMSKTAGIIKLDSTSSKVATSGGQTIVKVAPKIGQTQIKIVKKDGNTTKQIIQVAPKPITSATSTPAKITAMNESKLRKEIKKPVSTEPTFTSKVNLKKEEPPVPQKTTEAPESDDDDDGLEPLPFPDANEPIPDIDENADSDFVLDPLTGKIAGVEYEEKPVVIKEEPKPGVPVTSELENIVKMAAADLSDDDFRNSDSQDETLFLEKRFKTELEETRTTNVTSQTVQKVKSYLTGVGGNSPSPHKFTVQGQSNKISPRPAITTIQQQQPQRRPQPKVLNQSVTSRPMQQGQTRIVRHVIEPSRPGPGGRGGNINVIRKTVTSAVGNKPKFNLQQQKPLPSPLPPSRTYSTVRQSLTSTPGSKVQVFSSKSGPGQPLRRIGNTVVRATGSSPMNVQRQQPTQQIVQKQPPVQRVMQRVVSPKKPLTQQPVQLKPATPVKPRNIINMPSLTEEEQSPLLTTKTQQQKATTIPQKPIPPKQIKVEPKTEPLPVVIAEEPAISSTATEDSGSVDQTDWASFTMADADNPIYVTGDDGTIYQVAGQNEQGQTILITQGADGQQQCLLVTNEVADMAAEEPQASTSAVSAPTLPAATLEAEETHVTEVATPVAEEPVTVMAATEALESEPAAELAVPATITTPIEDESLQTPLQINTEGMELDGIDEGEGQDQVVAQVVRTEPPSPGGTHKVVVMLPDGNLMVTAVSPEEYASLELD